MRPRRDPKRKPPSEQALRAALRKDLPEAAPEPPAKPSKRKAPTRARDAPAIAAGDAGRPPAPAKARQKPRKKRKRPVRAGLKSARDRPERGADGPPGAVEPEPDGPGPEPTESEAGGPAVPPPPEPAAPQPDPRVEDLEDKVRRLTEALEGMSSDKSEMAGVAEKFKGMEDRMKGLLQLSEVLSVRYNPFLSNEEGDVFDGDRHDPSSLLPRAREAPAKARAGAGEAPRAAPAPLEDRFRGEVVRLESDEPGPDEPDGPDEAYTHEDDLDAELEAVLAPFAGEAPVGVEDVADDLVESGPDEDGERADEDEAARPGEPDGPEGLEETDGPEPAAPVAAGVGQELEEPETLGLEAVGPAAPEEVPETPPAAPAPAAPREAAPRPAPAHAPHRPAPPALPARPAAVAQPGPSPPYHAPGRSRESYLALCWFEQMAREGDPSEIHLFVDHYAGLGWIPPEHHGWMAYLAESVAPRDPDAAWDDVDLPAHELARLHRRNLRFLDKLFRCGLGADDPLRWDDEARWWMEDG